MKSSLGVYVHIPFCARICPYCDFAVEAVGEAVGEAGRGGAASGDWRETEDRYVEGLLAELALRAATFSGRSLSSIYFGGGTPSLLRPESLARIREAVMDAFPPGRASPEITLEVNPSTLERERLPAFRAEAGINRLSVGVQSFDDSVLKALGRAHGAEESRRTLEAARRAGFDNLSIDLIFAALHQTRHHHALGLSWAHFFKLDTQRLWQGYTIGANRSHHHRCATSTRKPAALHISGCQRFGNRKPEAACDHE